MSSQKPTAPLCPKMLSALPLRYREAIYPDGMFMQHWDGNAVDDGCRCRGSACALWVPATIEHQQKPQSAIGLYSRTDDNDVIRYRRGAADGTGWCADNMLREPWPDPAAKENDDD